MVAPKKKSASDEIAVPEMGAILSDDSARNVKSFADAITAAQAELGVTDIANAGDELGDGFRLLEDKDRLISTPFFIVDWRFLVGDQGVNSKTKDYAGKGLYSTIRLITEDDRKFRISDGSSGIHAQLFDFSQTHGGRTAAMMVKGGLVRSDYTTEIDGESVEGTTYYLSTSA